MSRNRYAVVMILTALFTAIIAASVAQEASAQCGPAGMPCSGGGDRQKRPTQTPTAQIGVNSAPVSGPLETLAVEQMMQTAEAATLTAAAPTATAYGAVAPAPLPGPDVVPSLPPTAVAGPGLVLPGVPVMLIIVAVIGLLVAGIIFLPKLL